MMMADDGLSAAFPLGLESLFLLFSFHVPKKIGIIRVCWDKQILFYAFQKWTIITTHLKTIKVLGMWLGLASRRPTALFLVKRVIMLGYPILQPKKMGTFWHFVGFFLLVKLLAIWEMIGESSVEKQIMLWNKREKSVGIKLSE